MPAGLSSITGGYDRLAGAAGAGPARSPLAMLSRSAQEPRARRLGRVPAALVGRTARDATSDDRAILVATLAAIAFRFACFALFEGAFEFSRLEVWLAYEGNPRTQVAFGAAIIATKLARSRSGSRSSRRTPGSHPPRAAARSSGRSRSCALRIAHIAIGMTLARGTFYSPYYDSGQLAFTYLMLLSAPIAIAREARGRRHPLRPRDQFAGPRDRGAAGP